MRRPRRSQPRGGGDSREGEQLRAGQWARGGSAGAPWFLEGRGLRERREGEHFPRVTFPLLEGRFDLGSTWGPLSKDPLSAPQ